MCDDKFNPFDDEHLDDGRDTFDWELFHKNDDEMEDDEFSKDDTDCGQSSNDDEPNGI